MVELVIKVEKATFKDKETGREIAYNSYYTEIPNAVSGDPMRIYLRPVGEYSKKCLKDYVSLVYGK